MKRILVFSTLFLGIMFHVNAQNTLSDISMDASAGTYAESSGSGISLSSNPSNAEAYIDGVYYGNTPIVVDYIRPGRRHIQIVKDGYRTRSVWVQIPEGKRLDASFTLNPLAGWLSVIISPAEGAPASLPLNPQVSVDGNPLLSYSPGLVSSGFRNVSVKAFGWESVSKGVFVPVNLSASVSFKMQPAAFHLSSLHAGRKRFNPENPGSLGICVLSFEVNAPGTGSISISNSAGEEVFYQELGPWTSWTQTIAWNGRDVNGTPLPDDDYTALIKGKSAVYDGNLPQEETLSVSLSIDSNLYISPQSTYSGVSGLLYAPTSDTLPEGSLQLDFGVMMGLPPGTSQAWNAWPISIDGRWSPLQNFELSGALTLNPGKEHNEKPLIGLGGGLKWNFLQNALLNLALGAFYGYSGIASSGGIDPWGMDSGAALYLPLQAWAGDFSAVFTPGLLWTGDKGIPSQWMPRVTVSGGIQYSGLLFSAGLSAKSAFRLDGGSSDGFIATGAEVKLLLPFLRSVFGLSGGWWRSSTQSGAWGGASIGFLF